jgi:hypothetical protein
VLGRAGSRKEPRPQVYMHRPKQSSPKAIQQQKGTEYLLGTAHVSEALKVIASQRSLSLVCLHWRWHQRKTSQSEKHGTLDRRIRKTNKNFSMHLPVNEYLPLPVKLLIQKQNKLTASLSKWWDERS